MAHQTQPTIWVCEMQAKHTKHVTGFLLIKAHGLQDRALMFCMLAHGLINLTL